MDWSGAYDNFSAIPDGQLYPARWNEQAAAFREAMGERARLDIPYGPGSRQRFDLFLPNGSPKGLSIFIHGGYWRAFDKSIWSHLASGAVQSGWAMVIPSYTLAPQQRISAITREVLAAVAAASREVGGPIVLAGHSAGGHLVTRLLCSDLDVSPALRTRFSNVMSISGLHDLRPLLKTSLNNLLRLDLAEARNESPALLDPVPGCPVTCWVGGAELPEFLRQNSLLTNVWHGCGIEIAEHVEPARHHFNVCDALVDPQSKMVKCLLKYGSEYLPFAVE